MTLTIYICLRYLKGLLWSLLGVLFLILLIDGSDQINFMSSNEKTFLTGVKSTALRIPSLLVDTLPLVVMLGSLITFISLSRSSELVVVRSAGRSVIRILWAPIIITILIGIFFTTIGNPIVATSIKGSEDFLRSLNLKPRNFMSVTGENIWLRDTEANKQTVIKASRTNFEGKILYDITLFEFDGEDNLKRKITARKGILKEGKWYLDKVILWTIKNNEPISKAFNFQKLEKISLSTNLSTEQILDNFADPKAINFWILPKFIEKLEVSGFSAVRHKVFYQSQLARPLFFVAMLLIGATFSLHQSRFGQTGILVVLSVSCGFLLFSIKRIAESLGAANEIPIYLAAFGPSVSGIFLIVGLLLHFEDG